tara:strand:+ start:2074 stop:2268 length:195 start_codon:yes stop_codon:yes gene_type:complete
MKNRNSYENLMTPFYQARIEAMTREIKKLNGKIECLEAQIEVAKEAHFKDWKDTRDITDDWKIN